jgi:UDP-N-acetyl-D-glucosamine dehydrogenase
MTFNNIILDSTSVKTIDIFESFKKRMETKQLRIGIIGLGYVGLPLACAYAYKGFTTTGFEIDGVKIKILQAGRSYIPDVSELWVQESTGSGRLQVTMDFEQLTDQDVIIICVPTPLRKTKEPDISHIILAAQQIKKRIRPGQLVILESTTYPGTTREILLSTLSSPDFQVGKDFFLAFSPERVDPGNSHYHIGNTPKVVGGITPACLELAQALYSNIVNHVVPVSSVEVAEMTKLLENTFRAVNIGLVNEMVMMCERLGINIWEVIEAAKTKPFGFMPFYPGPGIGGHCIPLDPHYLAWKIKTFDFEPRFIELAAAINARMPDFVVEKIGDILNRAGKALSQANVLALGVTYKKNTSDVRESPVLSIIEKLVSGKGTRVTYHDPYCPTLSLSFGQMESIPLDAETIFNADICVVLTDHANVNYPLILDKAKTILDTRNVFKGLRNPNLFYL